MTSCDLILFPGAAGGPRREISFFRGALISHDNSRRPARCPAEYSAPRPGHGVGGVREVVGRAVAWWSI